MARDDILRMVGAALESTIRDSHREIYGLCLETPYGRVGGDNGQAGRIVDALIESGAIIVSDDS